MSQANVDLVTASLREFQATLRATHHAAPDLVWDLSAIEGWPDLTKYFGPDGFNDFIDNWTEAYDEFEQHLEGVIDAGDEDVVSLIRQRGRLEGSQSWVELRFAIVWTVSEGKLKRGRPFRTAEEALEAVGLSKH